MTSPPAFFPPTPFTPAELSAACLDGDLRRLGEGYVPTGTPETPALRARSLSPLLGDGLAVALYSAAWVFGALPSPPTRHHLARSGPRRVTVRLSRRMLLHDAAVPSTHLRMLGPVPVSDPLWTALELSYRSARPGEEARAERAVHALVRSGAVDIAALRSAEEARGPVPGSRRARALLAGVAAAIRTR